MTLRDDTWEAWVNNPAKPWRKQLIRAADLVRTDDLLGEIRMPRTPPLTPVDLWNRRRCVTFLFDDPTRKATG